MDARRSRYHEVYARWKHDPEGFWGEAAQEIDWIEPAKRVFDPDAGIYGRQRRCGRSRRRTLEGNLSRNTTSKDSGLFLAGERADPDTLAWAENLLKKPVIDHWWQTETGWAIAGNPVGLGQLPVKQGSATVAMPGYDLRVVDETCKEMPANTMGSIVVKLPLPRAACRRCGGRTTGSSRATSPSFAVTTRRRMPASRTRMVTSTPMTSSTSPATGYQPAAWKRC
jgi:hypothetical protein